MKRLTVDQTWEQCLKMWKWISRQCKGKSEAWCRRNVGRLKQEWLEANGYSDALITEKCFLCDRTDPTHNNGYDCCKCPAVKVDTSFSCGDEAYCYQDQPRLFYAELKRLNKIRLGR